uniref:Uncharacterized protein LOC114329578 n=1 Tax=Diabrotica virgifera virgifera TaxID=50390 RepID=A0A6P7FNH2_DIAVI
MWHMITFLKSVAAFDRIYGLQILGISGIILFFISDNVKLIIYVFAFDNWRDNEDDYVINIQIIFFKFWNCCNLTSWLLIMIRPCHLTGQELNKILSIYCKILIELPHGIQDVHVDMYKESIVLIMKEMELQKPYFTACGLFEINFSLLMYMFSGVTTFVVVYVQLR